MDGNSIQSSSTPFCASSKLAATLTDEEFWDSVYPMPSEEEEYDWEHEEEEGWDELQEGYIIFSLCAVERDSPIAVFRRPDTGCPTCGESGACGYDSEGRPLIHPLREEP